MKKSFIILLGLFAVWLSVFTQKPPIKFGKIEKADLEMQYYERDSSAPAVILCDYGRFNGNTLRFTRLLRIKILKKEGLNWADKIFPTSSKSNIRGVTYNLENGEVIEEKLKPSSIFEERVTEHYYRMRVAMPDVKVGSVFDIEFNHFFIPVEWDFQNTIPVKWSELILEPTPHLTFQKKFYGYERLFITEDIRWVGKDMPAMKEEPFVNSIYNYITKFEFDILTVATRPFTTTWNAVATYLDDNSRFGDALSGAMFLSGIAKEIKEKYTNDEDMLKAAFEHVKMVKWNEDEDLFISSPNLSYAYRKQIGNSADINIILIQLLKKLGFETYPVIMSTRSNGILSPISPSLQKLNYVIAYTKINEKPYLLDATEELIPYYLLPKRCLNWQGRLLKDDCNNWIELTSPGKEKDLMMYDLNLLENMTLQGTLSCKKIDYAALDFRKHYKEFNSYEEFLEDYTKDKPGISILDSRIEKLDSIYFPVVENYDITIHDQLNVLDDEIYFIPMLYQQIKENPFKIEERKYPVDFAYPFDRTLIIKISFSDHYKISSLPDPISIRLPDNSGRFVYSVTGLNNLIQVTCKFSIEKSLFLPNEYMLLKEFYNQIIMKHSEPIILNKI